MGIYGGLGIYGRVREFPPPFASGAKAATSSEWGQHAASRPIGSTLFTFAAVCDCRRSLMVQSWSKPGHANRARASLGLRVFPIRLLRQSGDARLPLARIRIVER